MASVENKHLEATIEDADIEKARKLVGHDLATREPQYFGTAVEDNIRNFAACIGDDNPLYTDPDYARSTRWGGQIAPNMMAGILGKAMRGDKLPDKIKALKKGLFRGIHVFVSGGDWTWYRPIRPGDTIYSFEGEDGIEVKPSEYSGRTVTKFLRTVKVNQDGDVVAVYKKRSILSERKTAKKKGKYSELEPASYTEEDMAKIDALYEQETRQGATPRYWEDVQVGDDMGQMVKGPLTVTDIIVYHAGGYGFWPYGLKTGKMGYENRKRIPAFYMNNSNGVPDVAQRVHWDAELSKQTTGNPLPYDYGVMRETWLHHYLTNWGGDDSWVEQQYDEVRKFNYIGDTQFITGEVVNKRVEDGRYLVDVAVKTTSQRDVECTRCEATLVLPSKDHGPAVLPEPPTELKRKAAQMLARHHELNKLSRSQK